MHKLERVASMGRRGVNARPPAAPSAKEQGWRQPHARGTIATMPAGMPAKHSATQVRQPRWPGVPQTLSNIT